MRVDAIRTDRPEISTEIAPLPVGSLDEDAHSRWTHFSKKILELDGLECKGGRRR